MNSALTPPLAGGSVVTRTSGMLGGGGDALPSGHHTWHVLRTIDHSFSGRKMRKARGSCCFELFSRIRLIHDR